MSITKSFVLSESQNATLATLSSDDNLYVAAGVTLAVNAATAIDSNAAGTSHIALIDGTIVGQAGALILGSLSNITYAQDLTISQSGSLLSVPSGAVSVIGNFSTVDNAGRISGYGNALQMYSSAGSQTVTNSGLIKAVNGTAITHTGGANDIFVLLNTGTIQGKISYSDGGASSDQITNQGTMIGTVYLYGGADHYDGQAGHLRGPLYAGDGNDTIYGGTDGETLSGGNNEDLIRGGAGNDVMDGGSGNDALKGGDGADTIYGGLGTDLADYSDKAVRVGVTLNGDTLVSVSINGVAEDRLSGIEQVTGGSAGDTLVGDSLANRLIGNAGADTINGAGGSDVVRGGSGKDSLDGGAGTDTADFSDRTNVELTLAGTTPQSVKIGGVIEDTIRNFERAIGGAGNDKMTGDASANLFTGNAGKDTLLGNGGDDTLIGGLGQDSMTGGTGADHFRFAMTADFGASDRITDFVHGSDRLELDDIGSIAHQIDASTFSSVASGHVGDADDLFVYDRATGLLWFDTNGNTAGGQIVLIELSSRPQNLSATDLWYI